MKREYKVIVKKRVIEAQIYFSFTFSSVVAVNRTDGSMTLRNENLGILLSSGEHLFHVCPEGHA